MRMKRWISKTKLKFDKVMSFSFLWCYYDNSLWFKCVDFCFKRFILIFTDLINKIIANIFAWHSIQFCIICIFQPLILATNKFSLWTKFVWLFLILKLCKSMHCIQCNGLMEVIDWRFVRIFYQILYLRKHFATH